MSKLNGRCLLLWLAVLPCCAMRYCLDLGWGPCVREGGGNWRLRLRLPPFEIRLPLRACLAT
eukprot:scaffold109_cov252-Pinguiococcus_pyrenoidosus.AAC.84